MNTGNTNFTESEKIRLIVRDETSKLLLAHLELCPFAGNKIAERTRTLETKIATLIGLMTGSCLLGGMSGAAVSKLMN